MELKEIVDYFQSKGLKTSYNRREVCEESHAKAFTAAKMTDIDSLTKSIKEGWSEGHFTSESKNIFAKKGRTGFKRKPAESNSGANPFNTGAARQAANPKTGKYKPADASSNLKILTLYRILNICARTALVYV